MNDTLGMSGPTQWGSGPAVEAKPLSPGDKFGERYEIVRELGAGGMGLVYLAKDTLTEREIVLKLIHPSLIDERAVKRMIEEGVLASQIRHPNVVAVHHVDQVDGQTFLTMEHVEGKTLRQWIGENVVSQRETPLDQAIAVIKEILSGLTAAHGAGVVHRDLKPENVILTGDPGAEGFGLKILDFGIARGFKTEVFTSSTPAMGTPLYMAPEQKTMPDAAGPSADLYSVGRMFYEILLDVLPDGAWTPPSEQRQDLPKALDEVLAKSANNRPKARYQTAAEFASAIDAALGAAPKPVPPPPPADDIDPPKPEPKLKPEGGEGLEDQIKTLGKNKNLKYALYGVLGLAVVGGIADEMGVFEPTYTPPITPVQPIKPVKPVQPIEPVIPAEASLLQRFQNFYGVQYSWRHDATGEVFVVKQDVKGQVAGFGATDEYDEVVFFGVLGGPLEVLRVEDGASVGELNGGVSIQQSGGQDFTGTFYDYASGARSPVRFHVNH